MITYKKLTSIEEKEELSFILLIKFDIIRYYYYYNILSFNICLTIYKVIAKH